MVKKTERLASRANSFRTSRSWRMSADLEAASREPVMRFQRQIGIRRKRENYLVTFPGWLHQLLAQQLRRSDFDYNLAIEIRAGAVAEIFVRRPAETIRASMNAAAITVDGVVKAN